MPAAENCPPPEQLAALLGQPEGDTAQQELLAHLEQCSACQAAVERLAGESAAWAKAAAHLQGEAAPVEAERERLQAHYRAPPALHFLQPSQRDGELGRLGRYAVLAEVGRGAMGIVLKARDESLERIVAIKVMMPTLAVQPEARKRFLREARAMAAVKHEHVIAVHAVEEHHEPPYLVMEYIAGTSLQALLDREGSLELKRILRIGMQAAEGLAAAHAQGLVHRDIKPDNILLENGVERVKLTDFGLARAVNDASLTQSGVVTGTPQYMAPEQAQGNPVDHRTDLFSLGCVLYEMSTGRRPFRGELFAVLKQVCDATPPPPRDLNRDLPPALSDYIGRLMAKRPEERPQSAAEVAQFFRQFLTAGTPAALPPSPTRRRWSALVAVPVLAVCLLAGVWFFPGLWPTGPGPRLAASPTASTPVTKTLHVTFDEIDAGSTLNGAQGAVVEDYLAKHGITFRSLCNDHVFRVQSRHAFMHQGRGYMEPPSYPNFWHGPMSYEITFPRPVVSVKFARVGISNAGTGVTHPEWTAIALNAQGQEVSRAGEPLLRSLSDVPPQRFTLGGPGIVKLRVHSDNKRFAGFGSLLMDDLTLTWEE